MSLQLIRLTDTSSAGFRFAEKLLTASFPEDEYRDLGEWRLFTAGARPEFHNMLIADDNLNVGILTWWDFGSWRYIEHFAVDPALRDRGYGALALSLFRSMSAAPVALEVETPADSLSRRRIEFYRRAGFRLLPDSYTQPAYRRGGNCVEMRIMTTAGEAETPGFSEIERTLRRRVYSATDGI